MQIKFSAIFNRKNKLNSKGQAPIEVRAYRDRKRRYFTTGIFILPAEWDYKKEEVNKKHPNSAILNMQIQEMMRNFERLQIDHFVKDKPLPISSLKIKKDTHGNDSFIKFVKAELSNDETLTTTTKRSHFNTLNKLLEFRQSQDILFEEIDYSFIDDFMNYLRREGFAMNTIHKQHKNLKKYIELSIKKGLYTGTNPCKEIRVKTEQKKREVLTYDEIKQIELADLEQLDSRLTTVRDMFLFSCYTGLRISDVLNLKPEYVKKDKTGFYALDFVTIKVGKRAEIPLHNLFLNGSILSKPELILEKYLINKEKTVFPRLSEAYINRNLKVISAVAKVDIKLTFHTARHSFGTFMATKIPLPHLMYLMQHSDIKTTMTYVNTSQKMVQEGLLKVDWD